MVLNFVKYYKMNCGNVSVVLEFYYSDCDQNPKGCTEDKPKISVTFITGTKPKHFSGYPK